MPAVLRSLSERAWFAPAVLAIPFLVMIAVLRGMTATLPIFHGSDELVYHYPTILRFSRELPFPDLHSYHAAQTPLYHLLMAYIGKVIGYQLWRLRLVQVLISYGLALAVFGLLAKRLRMDRLQALAMTLLFVISPYVFGQSFRLGTDNLALLFSILAIDRFERFRECDRLGPFLAGCALITAATLTRQSAAFLVPVAVLYVLRPGAKLSWSERAVALGAVALSVVPVGLLFLNWHGLVPVGGDPGSCGLCASQGSSGVNLGGLEVQTMELALASIGIYGTDPVRARVGPGRPRVAVRAGSRGAHQAGRARTAGRRARRRGPAGAVPGHAGERGRRRCVEGRGAPALDPRKLGAVLGARATGLRRPLAPSAARRATMARSGDRRLLPDRRDRDPLPVAEVRRPVRAADPAVHAPPGRAPHTPPAGRRSRAGGSVPRVHDRLFIAPLDAASGRRRRVAHPRVWISTFPDPAGPTRRGASADS